MDSTILNHAKKCPLLVKQEATRTIARKLLFYDLNFYQMLWPMDAFFPKFYLMNPSRETWFHHAGIHHLIREFSTTPVFQPGRSTAEYA